MQDTRSPYEHEPPSGRRLLTSTVIALALAAVLLVCVVLPAEYGMDPTGIGTTLGLTGLSHGGTRAPVAMDAQDSDPEQGSFRVQGQANTATVYSDEPVPLDDPGVHQRRGSPFRSQTVAINMAADEQLEFKIVMDRDQVVVYSWQTDRGVLYYDFHGEPEAGTEGYWVRYEEGDERSSAHGSLQAPFTGMHGWYFLNYNEHPVTVQLRISGYYRELVELGRSSVFQ